MSFGDESVVVPDLAEPILAYRGFNITKQGEAKGFGDTVWPKKGLTAEHIGRGQYPRSRMRSGSASMLLIAGLYDHGSPVPCIEGPCPPDQVENHVGYGCGIYGWKSVTDLATHGNDQVWAQVLLWGKVYEHASGWRAEHGQVHAIYKVPNSPDARLAAKWYGVELLPLPLTQAELVELRKPPEPPPDPSPLKPRAAVGSIADPAWHYAMNPVSHASFIPADFLTPKPAPVPSSVWRTPIGQLVSRKKRQARRG